MPCCPTCAHCSQRCWPQFRPCWLRLWRMQGCGQDARQSPPTAASLQPSLRMQSLLATSDAPRCSLCSAALLGAMLAASAEAENLTPCAIAVVRARDRLLEDRQGVQARDEGGPISTMGGAGSNPLRVSARVQIHYFAQWRSHLGNRSRKPQPENLTRNDDHRRRLV